MAESIISMVEKKVMAEAHRDLKADIMDARMEFMDKVRDKVRDLGAKAGWNIGSNAVYGLDQELTASINALMDRKDITRMLEKYTTQTIIKRLELAHKHDKEV